MVSMFITEKKSVANEFIEVLNIENKEETRYYVKGRSAYLGKDVLVTWCRGHLVTMSYPEIYDEKYKKWNLADLPFLPEKYLYEVIKDCNEHFGAVEKCYNGQIAGPVTELYLCPDAAREGLLIQMMVRNMALKQKIETEKVVWLDSFTPEEIKRGIREAKPLIEYAIAGKAAKMRAVEDYLIGINFSRALSCKYGNKLNKQLGLDKWISIAVGRVMTTVMAMVVQREREIKAFKEMPFYRIIAENGAEWTAVDGTMYHESPALYNEKGFKDSRVAQELCTQLNKDCRLTVADVSKTVEKKYPPLLFNLAEAQSELGNKYKLTPNEVLDVIQSLYEKKLVSYPRTDARVLSSAMGNEVSIVLQKLLKLNYRKEYIQEIMASGKDKEICDTRYVDDALINDHYAIIPTGITTGSESLSEKEQNIYHDIIERFLSIFMPPAIYEKQEVRFAHSQKEYFFIKNKVLKNKGYLSVLSMTEEQKEEATENGESYQKGQILHTAFEIKEGKTTGPKRYTASSMILAMENAGKLIEDEELRSQIKSTGIGTSATRGAILDKLVDIQYIACNKKTLVLTPTTIGECIYDIIIEVLPEMTSPEMTANWELGLKQIENEEITYKEFKDILYDYIRTSISNISQKEVTISEDYKPMGNRICPVCKKGKILLAKSGKSYYCSEYRNGCKFTIWKSQRGYELTEKDVDDLINKGKTKNIVLNKKDGSGTYDGHFMIKDTLVEYVFAKHRKKKGE